MFSSVIIPSKLVFVQSDLDINNIIYIPSAMISDK